MRDRLSAKDYDLLLMDLNYARDTTSGREGLELLTEVHERDRLLPIIVMTGWGSIETAVEAMRRGARTFVHKPWDNVSLTETVTRELDDARARREADAHASRELEHAQRIQRALLPSPLPEIDGCDMAAHVEAGHRRSAATATTCCGSRPRGSVDLDRRCRGQGSSGGAADGEPAGIGSRVRRR